MTDNEVLVAAVADQKEGMVAFVEKRRPVRFAAARLSAC